MVSHPYLHSRAYVAWIVTLTLPLRFRRRCQGLVPILFHSGPTLPIASCTHQLVPGCHQVLDACMLVQSAILIPRLIIHYFMRACPWKASLGTLTGISAPSISTYFNHELCLSLPVPPREKIFQLWRIESPRERQKTKILMETLYSPDCWELLCLPW